MNTLNTASIWLALVSVTQLLASPVALALPALDLPWGCDVEKIITQGHNTGSHTGKGAWAWDVNVAEGEEVFAVADGVVRHVKQDSTRYGCSSSFANDGNHVVIDFEDGTEALYLHLQAGSVTVNEGARVARGQPLGRVGKSGWICGVVNEGVHLHFQIQQSCTSWYCQSIPATFDQAGDPGYGQRVTSSNCGGNIFCEVMAHTARIIDERDTCFRRVTQWWWEEQGGHQGSWLYTYALDADEPDTEGWWRFKVMEHGHYDLEVHIPPGAQSRQARYHVALGGQLHGPFQIDQTAQQGWVRLTTLPIQPHVEAHIHLGDNTGEPYTDATRRRIAFDAVRIGPHTPEATSPEEPVPTEPSPPEAPPPPEAPGLGEPPVAPDMVQAQLDPSLKGADMAASGDMSAGSDSGEEAAAASDINAEGSICAVSSPRHTPQPGGVLLLGALFGLLAGVRRHRSETSAQ